MRRLDALNGAAPAAPTAPRAGARRASEVPAEAGRGAPPERTRLSLSRAAQFMVKEGEDPRGRLSPELDAALQSVLDDVEVAAQDKQLLYFNLVLRPQSEARMGRQDLPAGPADAAAWGAYLRSLLALNPYDQAIAGQDRGQMARFGALLRRVLGSDASGASSDASAGI